MSGEVEVEPVPGLPELLPEGERIVWQGTPQWKSFAMQTFRLRWLAAYFGVMAALRVVFLGPTARGFSGVAQVLVAVVVFAACLGGLTLLGWLNARATVYTVTTKRVVMRIGIALPTTFNLPFKRLAAADLKLRTKTDGDIALQIAGTDRIAWLHLWPHVQPLHYKKARPMLRALAEPERVSALLADAVHAWATANDEPILVAARSAELPSSNVSPAPHTPFELGHELATEASR